MRMRMRIYAVTFLISLKTHGLTNTAGWHFNNVLRHNSGVQGKRARKGFKRCPHMSAVSLDFVPIGELL